MRLFTLAALLLTASSHITAGRAGAPGLNHPAACEDGDRGRLIRFEHVAAFPTAASARAYFDEWIAFYDGFYNFPDDLPVNIVYGFDSYKVTYCTVDAHLPGHAAAEPSLVTGLIAVPRKRGPLSTVAYVHGTSVSFYDAPSNPRIVGPFSDRGESFEGPPGSAVFAGGGFIVVAPDDLGLGDSTVPRHRYFDAATEASAAVDLLSASRGVLAALRVHQNGKLFVFGFSQGGHSALALHRELQRAHVDVVGTATVGGIFDVERWFLSLIERDETPTLPLYASYILLAYDDIHDVFRQTSEVFRRPYAPIVSDLFDMRHFFDDVVAALGPTTRETLKPSFVASVTTDRHHPLRVALRENAVDNWRPFAPIRVYQSTADEEMPYEQAVASVERLRQKGADVTVRTFSEFDHVTSWIFAMPRTVNWFRSLE